MADLREAHHSPATAGRVREELPPLLGGPDATSLIVKQLLYRFFVQYTVSAFFLHSSVVCVGMPVFFDKHFF